MTQQNLYLTTHGWLSPITGLNQLSLSETSSFGWTGVQPSSGGIRVSDRIFAGFNSAGFPINLEPQKTFESKRESKHQQDFKKWDVFVLAKKEREEEETNLGFEELEWPIFQLSRRWRRRSLKTRKDPMPTNQKGKKWLKKHLEKFLKDSYTKYTFISIEQNTLINISWLWNQMNQAY